MDEPAGPPLNVQRLLQQYQLKAKKSLGQNFLVDPQVLESILRVAEIHSSETVLEIGPGLGSLTRLLAAHSRRVVAVELDEHLKPVLAEVLAGAANVFIVWGDILRFDPGSFFEEEDQGYLVAANIPYYITSAVIRHLLEARIKPSRLILTVQLEVAQRICAPAGALSLLALGVQVYGKPSLSGRIPAGAFYPAPKVDSAIVKVELYPQPLIANTELFFRLAKAAFSQKRKTLRNALAGGLHLPPGEVEDRLRRAGIDPQRRAQTVGFEEWRKLVEVFD